jgi:hypothetical protein
MSFDRIDTRPLAADGRVTSVICPVRDEIGLLPHFLDHHRRLGVRQFILIDNASNDGTTEYALSQPDCVVYFTDESYYTSAYGRNWINRILADNHYAGWLIYLDADEHLVYRGAEDIPVQGFLQRLQAEGADCALAAMVDMYPDGDFASVKIGPHDNLHAKLPWFDSDYVLRPWPTRPWDPPADGFRLQVLGGPRCRLLSELGRERRRGALHYTLARQIDRVVDAVPLPMIPVLARLWPRELPWQQKQPVNLVRPGFAYADSHTSSNTRAAGELTALLHFKFCHELQQRLRCAATEGNHHRRGLAHRQLEVALQRWGERPLTYAGSRRYRGSQDLEAVGLIGPRAATLWTEGAREFATGDRRRRYAPVPERSPRTRSQTAVNAAV